MARGIRIVSKAATATEYTAALVKSFVFERKSAKKIGNEINQTGAPITKPARGLKSYSRLGPVTVQARNIADTKHAINPRTR